MRPDDTKYGFLLRQAKRISTRRAGRASYHARSDDSELEERMWLLIMRGEETANVESTHSAASQRQILFCQVSDIVRTGAEASKDICGSDEEVALESTRGCFA